MRTTILIWTGVLLACVACTNDRKTLFELVPSEKSTITFVNQVTESDSLNILDYEYFYNGAGVAVTDFTNDGFADIYFVGNVVANRLYLNQGDMQFRDVTRQANAAGTQYWETGVATVDINRDDWMDIYISVAGEARAAHRKNVLLIHQGLDADGIPSFKNKAEEYGLAGSSYSTQTAFLDYDHDGDLDMYEVVSDIRRASGNAGDTAAANTDNLYRSEWDSTRQHPYFTEVSSQAGITRPGYGLGLSIVDINEDGWQDIYVSNDFSSDDLLWINNQDGTFTNKLADYFKHTSFSAMGTDVADINNDGLMDILTLDMAGSNHVARQTMTSPNSYENYFNKVFRKKASQFTRNTLQLNQGVPGGKANQSHPIFSEIALLAGVAGTDWSWGILMADFNHDRLNDMVITNGIPRNKIDKDFVRFRDQVSTVAPDYMLLDSMPRAKTPNMSFKNEGSLTFSASGAAWGLNARAYSTGMASGDLDNDGDLDLVMNNINGKAFLYENTLDVTAKTAHWLKIRFEAQKQSLSFLGAKVSVYKNGYQQVRRFAPYRGYLSTVERVVHFGLGSGTNVDSVVVKWNNRKRLWKEVKVNQTLHVAASSFKKIGERNPPVQAAVFKNVTDSSGISYRHTERSFSDFRRQRTLPYEWSQFGPSLAVGDINGDSLSDLYIGGSHSKEGTLLIQQKDGSFRQRSVLMESTMSRQHKDGGALFFDADRDGDQDLYVVSSGTAYPPEHPMYEDRLYVNQGDGTFVLAVNALPSIKSSGSAVKAADFDHDQDLDLFVGGRIIPGFYPAPVSSKILRNDTSANGDITFTDVTASVAPALQKTGMVMDALWTDYDNDGWQDLLIAGEWMPLTLLKNERGSFQNRTSELGLGNSTGWWNSLTAGDFDSDGDTDYVAGNLGLNTIYKASREYPVSVYADDFDSNGAYDALLSVYAKDESGKVKEFLAHSYDEFKWQLPRRARGLPTVKRYARATVSDLFSTQELKKALTYRATQLQSCYIENKGNRFAVLPLPIEAQFAPIFGMITSDVTADGNLDVILSGNLYGAEVQVGHYDAFNGLVLAGNGEGGFHPLSLSQSGVYIPGDGKALVKLRSAGGRYLLAASQNQGPLLLFGKKEDRTIWSPEPMDVYGMLHFSNGEKQKYEFYHGSSFQSASERFLVIPDGATKLVIYDSMHQKRQISFQ